MTRAERRIDVLLCTFRRPDVHDTLRSLEALALPAGVDLRIVVVDNVTTSPRPGTGSLRPRPR